MRGKGEVIKTRSDPKRGESRPKKDQQRQKTQQIDNEADLKDELYVSTELGKQILCYSIAMSR